MGADSSEVQRRITAFWSMVGAGYDAHEGNLPDAIGRAAWLDVMRSRLPASPADVLDVGTGTGFLALLAASLGHRVTGVDLAPGMLEVARAHARESGSGARFEIADAVAPPFAGGTFDVITSRHVLWTLREPEAAFVNWHRLLRAGGYLLAVDGQWFAPAAGGGDAVTGDAGNPFDKHYTPETRAALPMLELADTVRIAEMLRDAGFRDVSVEDLPRALWTAEPAGEKPPYVVVARR
jgi:SAM-dependent methyltransferase